MARRTRPPPPMSRGLAQHIRGRLRDRDKGYRGFRDILQDVQSAGVYVGILQDKGSERTEDGEITLAGYAAVNEFGSDDGHVPERSFLRSTIDEHRAEYDADMQAATRAMLQESLLHGVGSGASVLERRLGQLGNKVTRHVKEKIRDLRDPPNAELTLALKYPGDNPLIHTGRMRQSISFLVDLQGRARRRSLSLGRHGDQFLEPPEPKEGS